MSYKPKDTKERTLHRLKIARGHLDKVIKMVDDGEYCIDVLHQSQAVQKAIKETDNLILENHLNTCVAHSIANGRKSEAINEIMQVFKKS